MASDDGERERMVDAAVLARLRAAVKRHAPELVDAFAPGARSDELRRALGRRLPSELGMWFSWIHAPTDVPFGWAMHLLPAHRALRLRRVALEVAADLAGRHGRGPLADPSVWWSPAWLPVAETIFGDALCCDVSGPADRPVAVYYVRWDSGLPHEPLQMSLRDIVERWIDDITGGIWSWNAATRRWDQGPTPPPDVRFNGHF